MSDRTKEQCTEEIRAYGSIHRCQEKLGHEKMHRVALAHGSLTWADRGAAEAYYASKTPSKEQRCPLHGPVRHADCPGCPDDAPLPSKQQCDHITLTHFSGDTWRCGKCRKLFAFPSSPSETTDYRAAYNRVAIAARAVTAELQKVGDETGWRDGDETDRVYAWYEMLPLVEALNADIQQPSLEEPTREYGPPADNCEKHGLHRAFAGGCPECYHEKHDLPRAPEKASGLPDIARHLDETKPSVERKPDDPL